MEKEKWSVKRRGQYVDCGILQSNTHSMQKALILCVSYACDEKARTFLTAVILEIDNIQCKSRLTAEQLRCRLIAANVQKAMSVLE